MPQYVLNESIIRDKVRQYVDPLFTKLQERIYGSGTSYNTNISKTVLPPDTTYDGDVEGIVTAAGFIKGIITYLGNTLIANTQKELSMSGAGLAVVTGSSVGSRTTYVVSGTAGFTSPLTTKGDLLVHSGGTVSSRFAVGVDGTYLAADSTQPLGVRWTTVSGGTTASGNYTYTGAIGSEPAANSGDLYLSNNGLTIERYTGSTWAPWGPIFPFTAPPTSGWSWANQGSATVDTTNGGIYLLAPAAAGDNLRQYLQTVPTAPYTIVAAIMPHTHKVNFNQIAVCWTDGTKIIGVQFDQNFQCSIPKWTNETTFSAGYITAVDLSARDVIWLKLVDNNTNRIVSWSIDGQHWHQLHSVSRTDFLTATHVGIYATSSNSTYPAAISLLSWNVS